MGNPQEPFRALAPVDWADVPQDGLKPFLTDVFSQAHTVIDSVPATTPSSSEATQQTGRARAQTDSAILNGNGGPVLPGPSSAEQVQQLQKDWKEVKVNPRENPLGVKVYKLGAKDGRGAWFARRSIHEGLTFDQWKAGLDREFIETMEVQEGPGSGSIRGIGADKRVEDKAVPNSGHAQVFQLSAQFPGPTSPRDFITLLLTSDFSQTSPEHPEPLRQYMIISKPCVHPECPPRQGIIRGQYESVEVIREVPLESNANASKRSHSSADLTGAEKSSLSVMSKSAITANRHAEAPTTAIEWLMVTRSDPGGSVPRFMIEKGTPPGIVNDAGKFLHWVNRKLSESAEPKEEEAGEQQDNRTEAQAVSASGTPGGSKAPPLARATSDTRHPSVKGLGNDEGGDESAWSSNGLYGIITGAFGAASSAVSGGLLRSFSTADENLSSGSESPVRETIETIDSASETSSIRSFTSAVEKSLTNEAEGEVADSAQGSHSETKSQENQPQQQKELRRLEERRRKLDEKAAKLTERLEKERQSGKEKDVAAAAKVREKHEREIAKHEAKYKREVRRLEEKREQEERKAEERRKKAAEREEKASMSLELERVRAEKELAAKQVELLKNQVGELQAQNTMLAAKLGRAEGHERTTSMSTTSSSIHKAEKTEKPEKEKSARGRVATG